MENFKDYQNINYKTESNSITETNSQNNNEAQNKLTLDNNTEKVLKDEKPSDIEKISNNKDENLSEETFMSKYKKHITILSIITVIVVISCVIVFPVLFAGKGAKIIHTAELENSDVSYRISEVQITDLDENKKYETVYVSIHNISHKPESRFRNLQGELPQDESCVSSYSIVLAATFIECNKRFGNKENNRFLNDENTEDEGIFEVQLSNKSTFANAISNRIRILIENGDEDKDHLEEALRHLQEFSNESQGLPKNENKEDNLKIFDSLDDALNPSPTDEKDLKVKTIVNEVLIIPKDYFKTSSEVVILNTIETQNSENTRKLFSRRIRRSLKKVARAVAQSFELTKKVADVVLEKVVNPAIKESISAIQKAGPVIGAVVGATVGTLACGPGCGAIGLKYGTYIGLGAQTALNACPPEYGKSGGISSFHCNKDTITQSLVNGAVSAGIGFTGVTTPIKTEFLDTLKIVL